MERAVYKFSPENAVAGLPFEIETQKGSKLLDSNFQGKICFWFLVNPSESEKEIHSFIVFATGDKFQLTDKMEYFKTIYIISADFLQNINQAHEVYHIFKIKK